ncbi:stimulated by retinoic acid gene 6 protein-like [Patiria miniata]|uniref:Uncharacterized protein n=1 Tax=Patiria miniata TaxID=46514 RepID=A0A914BR37_PATMI|nr:stimulated by retinoic acid gene 6 protein-like [Patiria miniata]
MLNATGPPTTPDPGCDNLAVRLEYWVYATIPISVAIIFIFAFFEERVKLWPTCCFQRPAIPYPVNLVDSYNDRWSFASAFSVMSTSVLQLFWGDWIFAPDLSGIHNMLRGTILIFVGLANVLLISLVFYPILLCLRIRSTHGLTGNFVGFLYTNIWLTYNLLLIVHCGRGQGLSRNTIIALTVPVYINYTLLNIGFAIELLKAIRRNLCKVKNITVHAEEEEDYFKKTHYYERVRFLFSPPKEEEEKGLLNRLIRKIWIDAPGFRYSTRSVCTMVLSTITTYQIGLLYITIVNSLWDIPDELLKEDGLLYQAFSLVNSTSYVMEARAFFDIAEDMFWIACYFAIALAVLYNIHVQICYREHTLLLWRGVKDFCPKEKFSLPALVVANLRYSGYAIAFSAWGFVITQVVSWLLLFFVAYFIVHQLQIRVPGEELSWLLSFLEGYWLTFVMGFVFYYLQVAIANLTFLQKEKEKEREKVHLNLNNRRLFHWTVYITLFMNVVVGLVSCLMRIIKAVFFGVLFIGRIDKCTLMRGWELWDPGFKSYLGFLQLEVAHTHPVLITFCHFLWKSVGKDMREHRVPLVFWRRKPAKMVNGSNELSLVTSSGHSRKKLWPRNKWFVALTLMRNRALTVDRMRISPELQRVKEQLERERREAQSRGSDKTDTTELTIGLDEQDAKSIPVEEGRLPAADEGKKTTVDAVRKGQVSNQVPTEAEISRDSGTISPEPSRPAARLSTVAWEGQAAAAEPNHNPVV